MPLSELRVSGYRSFARPQQLRLRPITLIFGDNSAGKSSLVRALALLAASMRHGRDTPLSLDEAPGRNTNFSELTTKIPHYRGTPVELGLNWLPSNDKDSAHSASWKFLELTSRRRHIIERFQHSVPNERTATLELLLAESEAAQTQIYVGEKGLTSTVRFDGLVPTIPDDKSQSNLADVASKMRILSQSLAWLGSLRAVPPRRQELLRPGFRIDKDGTGVAEFLGFERLDREGSIIQEISDWYQHATRQRFQVLPVASGEVEQVSLRLGPESSSHSVDIADTGEGMAQVLPVIALASLAKHGRLGAEPVLCIEQPELHLHPRVHQEVAALFCDVVRSRPAARCILETHSENLLLRFQLAVVRGEIKSQDIALHWIDQTPDGESIVNEILLDDDGFVSGAGWPPGIFEEDTKLAREISIRRSVRSGK